MSTTLLNAYLEPVMVALHRSSQPGPGQDRHRLAAALPDAVERRRDAVLRGDRRRPHGPHAVLRARGRRAGQRLSRQGGERGLPRSALSRSTWAARAATSPSSRAALPLETTEGLIARRQVDVPALDMTTISAGGGSIAGIDGGGFLTVGPAQRRRRSGAGLLRPRRHAADRHRCRSALRLPQRRLFPRRQAEARRRRVARRAGNPYRQAAEA